MTAKKSESSFRDLLNCWIYLQEENPVRNRRRMNRLALEMKDKAQNFDDKLEIACILGQKSQYFKSIFEDLRSLAVDFKQSDQILTCCCEEGDEYYFVILQDLRNKATDLNDWFIVYGELACLLNDLGDTCDKSLKNISIINEYSKQLKDAFDHILALSQTISDCDEVIFFFTNGSHEVERIIQQRDELLKQG